MSHLWEMEVINGPLDALHGEKVSVGTVLVLREYKRIARAIREGRCTVKPYESQDKEILDATFGKKGLLDRIQEENAEQLLKEVDPARLESCLPEIADIIEQLPDEEDMIHLLDKAGCKTSVRDIGLGEETVPLSLRLAPYVRRRLSFLHVSKMLDIRGE